jgi:hypothetical protein
MTLRSFLSLPNLELPVAIRLLPPMRHCFNEMQAKANSYCVSMPLKRNAMHAPKRINL